MTATVVMEVMVAAVAVAAEATGEATVMEEAAGVAVVEEVEVAGVVAAMVATVTTTEVAAEVEVVGVAVETAGVVAMTWVGGGQAVEIAAVSRSSIRLTSAMRLVAAPEVTEAVEAAMAT